MAMDSHSNIYSYKMSGFEYSDNTFLPSFYQSENFINNYQLKDDILALNFLDTPFVPIDPNPSLLTSTASGISELDSPDDSDDNVLKFINSILMEENIENKPSLFHDPLALQATERSLYDIIGEKYPSSPTIRDNSPDDYLFGSSSEHSSFSNNSVDSQWIIDPGVFKQSEENYHFEYTPETTIQKNSESSYDGSMKSFDDNGNSTMDYSNSKNMVSSIFTVSESILLFQKGVEEANKFLPKSTYLLLDLDNYSIPLQSNDRPFKVEVHENDENKDTSPSGPRVKRNHLRTDTFEEERISKQSAIFEEESETELSEFFDKVLLCTDEKGQPGCCNVDKLKIEPSDTPQQNNHLSTKKGNKYEVDLRTLLINCAQSVASDDRITANEKLKYIRQHCSPFGDGYQRVANIFANGLEARLAGTGSQKYAALASKRIAAVELLKAYQLYLSSCPFKKLSMTFSNKLIYDLARGSSKKKLHIIDFGICYGFQWPILIHFLSKLPDGPPELRITGIEVPLPGFRPAEMVEETGRRLSKYCERFNVKFNYHPIAQKWETIKLEDLNLSKHEAIAVNCSFRFKNLLDETVDMDSPRDTVLKLIRTINPDIFISHTVNGSFNAPFFVTRFREALFHYSTHFDMFDTTMLSRENQMRINFEQAFYGREVMNIIACEGIERVERPETYKQWQVRNTRAGFKIEPLKEDLLKILKGEMVGYHKDFVIDEDGKWLLQGWKGRILCASSCWVPV